MAAKFTTIKGGIKSTDACERFTYSEKDGAGITLSENDVWSRYVKSHKHAKLFKTNGFLHFDTIEHLMPDASPGKYICWGPQATDPPIDNSTALGHQLSADNGQMCPPSSIPIDSNLVPSSAPSSFLSSFADFPTLSQFTSISHSKRKSDAMSAVASETSSHKWSCPMSTTALTQQASGVAMVDMVATMKDISRSFKAYSNDLEVAMDILNEHTELTTMQRLNISDYLADPKNLNHAVIFCKLHQEEALIGTQVGRD
ncbi:hypothetical protein HD554DRAFT_2035680 [Boletus coccyginus]|nr:hypothetical protein HD554DRAFT_2035680 [Boletus coccyginus]